MYALDSVLAQALSTPGVLGVAVVDFVTGLTYAEAGDCTAAGSGAEVSAFANLISDRLHDAGADGELENVVITSRRTHHILEVPTRRGDPVLMSAVLDREGTNLALTGRRISEHARSLLG